MESHYFTNNEHGYVGNKKGKSPVFLVLIPILGVLAFAGVAAVVLGLIPVYLGGKWFAKYILI